MKTFGIHVIDVTAKNDRYGIKDDHSVHYVKANSEEEAMNHVRENLGNAGWVIVGSSISFCTVVDLT